MEQRVPPLRLHKVNGEWCIDKQVESPSQPNDRDSEGDTSISDSSSDSDGDTSITESSLDSYSSSSDSERSQNDNCNFRRCGQCGEAFRDLNIFAAHRMECYPNPLPQHYGHAIQQGAGVRRYLHEHALNRTTYTIRFVPDNNRYMLPEEFFNRIQPYFNESYNQLLSDCQECRVHFVMQLRMIQIDAHGEVSRRDEMQISIPAISLQDYDPENVIQQILAKIELFVQNGSSWIVEGVDWFDFHITRFHSAPKLRGHGHFELPQRLKAKKAVINVENGSNSDCFKYAVLSVLHHDEIVHPERTAQYLPWMNSLKWDGLHFPMTAGHIKTFERNNLGIRINLLKWDEDENEHPVRVLYHTSTPVKENERIISILAVDDPEDRDRAHFVGVVNLNRLLSINGKRCSKYCERCLQPFKSNELLEKHRPFCYTGMQQTLVPAETTTHKFSNWQNIQRLPYCVYADIECILPKQDKKHLEKHVPAAFGFLLVANCDMSNPPLPNKYYHFVGPNCIEEGLHALDKLAREVYQWNVKNTNVKLCMTKVDKKDFQQATTCYMCKSGFIPNDPLKKKVKEHDHLNGKYRGAACQECNDKAKLNRRYLPVIFHNLRNYDMHALCSAGFGKLKEWQLNVIPQTEEKYMTLRAKFRIDSYKDKNGEQRDVYMTVRFLDSFQFLNTSLDNLVRNLSLDDLVHCHSLQLPTTELITAKGVFPYSYFDSFDRLSERSLPPRDAFRSSITGDDISVEDYERAKSAWDLLQCHTFGDYMLAYLKRDIYQLADVFEKFRTLCLNEDGLDPVYYVTLPGMTWDSAFKFTEVEVDLLSTVEMYEFMEKGIRGGMTFINEHHLKANNARVPNTFNPTKQSCDLLYVDANNLYGHALSQRLPRSNFRWLSDKEISQLDISTFDFSQDEGLILEVDLSYPTDVQDRTEDLPFAPEKLVVDQGMFTPLMVKQWSHLMTLRYGKADKTYRGCSKLLLTHYNRENYVVHGQLLQFYLKHGMQLTKIHRAIRFQQSAIFEPYISYNSMKRQKAKNPFEKDFYKLKNNALFGKTMENVRGHINFRLCNTEEKLITLASRPEFLRSTIFNEDLVGVRLVGRKSLCHRLRLG